MTTNKSLYQAPPIEVEWVMFGGTEELKQEIAKWAKSAYLMIEKDAGEWIYQSSSDNGSSGWSILPIGSLVCRNVANEFFYIMLPEEVEEYLERLTVIIIR